MPSKVIIANWKMKLGVNETYNLAKKMVERFAGFEKEEIVICPNFISLPEVKRILEGTSLKLGAQDSFWEDRGAYTGEISPDMLKEAGCEYAIIGHSERRKYLHENYEMIHMKTRAALNIKGLTPIVCIGEEAEDRKTDRRDFILVDQIQQALGGINIFEGQKVVLAYEPIWAIGSGSRSNPRRPNMPIR